MKSPRVKVLSLIFGLLLFGFIIGFLSHELKSYNLREVRNYLESLSQFKVLSAFALTVLSYLVLTGYDFLAFRYIGNPLSIFRILVASFIGYAFSHNLGFTMLTGAPVRYRMYSSWGLNGVDIAKVVTFCVLTFFLGFMIVGGAVFLFEPPQLPPVIFERFPSLQPLGVFCLASVALYLFWSAFQRKPLRLFKWELPIPPLKISLLQCVVSSLEWIVTGSILFVLLPAHSEMTYSWFLGIFLLAQVAGLISQVPGGLGVFDTVIIFGLTPPLSESTVIGALLAYRFMFYLLPLVLAILLLGIHEIHFNREFFRIFTKNKKSESGFKS